MTRTGDEIREDLRRRGQTIRQLADELGFSYSLVRNVIYGQAKGRYGQAHHVAVALGMKEKPE